MADVDIPQIFVANIVAIGSNKFFGFVISPSSLDFLGTGCPEDVVHFRHVLFLSIFP